MAVLARKINRVKWEVPDDLEDGEIPADAVSFDLRTKSNSLSFWACVSGGNKKALRNPVLALATAADRADRMDIAWVEEEALWKKEVATERSEGHTPVASLRNTHVDLVRLDVARLGGVAELIAEAIGSGNHCRMTRKQVVDIVVEAVEQNLVMVDALKRSFRESVEKALRDKVAQGES